MKNIFCEKKYFCKICTILCKVCVAKFTLVRHDFTCRKKIIYQFCAKLCKFCKFVQNVFLAPNFRFWSFFSENFAKICKILQKFFRKFFRNLDQKFLKNTVFLAPNLRFSSKFLDQILKF